VHIQPSDPHIQDRYVFNESKVVCRKKGNRNEGVWVLTSTVHLVQRHLGRNSTCCLETVVVVEDVEEFRAMGTSRVSFALTGTA
jgi:hypothetical protein